MSRYKCHRCEDEHGTDNMVAYCASCYDITKQKLKAVEDRAVEYSGEIGRLTSILDGTMPAQAKETWDRLEKERAEALARVKELESQVATRKSAMEGLKANLDRANERGDRLEMRINLDDSRERLSRAVAVIEGAEKALAPIAYNADWVSNYPMERACGIGCDMGEAGPGLYGKHDDGCPVEGCRVALTAIRDFRSQADG